MISRDARPSRVSVLQRDCLDLLIELRIMVPAARFARIRRVLFAHADKDAAWERRLFEEVGDRRGAFVIAVRRDRNENRRSTRLVRPIKGCKRVKLGRLGSGSVKCDRQDHERDQRVDDVFIRNIVHCRSIRLGRIYIWQDIVRYSKSNKERFIRKQFYWLYCNFF